MKDEYVEQRNVIKGEIIALILLLLIPILVFVFGEIDNNPNCDEFQVKVEETQKIIQSLENETLEKKDIDKKYTELKQLFNEDAFFIRYEIMDIDSYLKEKEATMGITYHNISGYIHQEDEIKILDHIGYSFTRGYNYEKYYIIVLTKADYEKANIYDIYIKDIKESDDGKYVQIKTKSKKEIRKILLKHEKIIEDYYVDGKIVNF